MATPVVYVEQVILEVLIPDGFLPTGITGMQVPIYPTTRDYASGSPTNQGVQSQ